MSGDEAFQFRVAPSRGASCIQGKWTDITSGDDSFSFIPSPMGSSGRVHVQVRLKPAFESGYYRLRAVGREAGHPHEAIWITDPKNSMVTRPDMYERVEVTPVDDEC